MNRSHTALWLFSTTLLGYSLACRQSTPEPAEPPTAQTSSSDPTTRTLAAVKPTSPFLLLLDYEPGATNGRIQPIGLSAESARLLPARELTATPAPEWAPGAGLLASHDGAGRFALVEHSEAGWTVRITSLVDNSSQQVALKAQPAALLLTGRALFVGRTTAVDWIDLEAQKPEPVELVAREGMGQKAYDLFARDGDTVIAIDDIVMPIWADSFRLRPDGTPEHLASFSMPGIINGSYQRASYLELAENRGTLFATARFSVMDGHGQDLVALPMQAGKPSVDVGMPLNATRSTNPPVLEEHVPRQSGRSPKLTAGKQLTLFSGIAIARRDGSAHHLLAAAGERGLFVLPLDFGPDTKATVVHLGAPVSDVVATGERLFALTTAELVELGWQGDTLVSRAKVPVTTKTGRFVR